MNKKTIGIIVLALVSIGIVSAALVTYLSNTATMNVNVESPMSIQFAEVDHGVDVVSAITNVAGVGTWFDDLTLTGTTGLSTSELGVKVENNADVTIASKILEVVVSNDLSNVGCGDITSLTFVDVGCSVGTGCYQVAQELTGIGLCTAGVNGTISYGIPINSLAPTTVYMYPVTLTFGNVAASTYYFEATLV